jgi:O-antigen/teichoic acid export membrane protein
MSDSLTQQVGSAMVWKTLQLGGVKVIFLVRTIILARLLIPDDFGLLAVSLVAVGFLMTVTNLGMAPALVQHISPNEQQYNTAWTIGVLRASLIAFIVFLTAPLIADLFAEPRAVDLIKVMALRPVLEAAASIKIAELTRNLRFRTLAFVYLPETLVNTIISIALAPFIGVWALVAGFLAGMLVFILMSYILAPHRPKLTLDITSTLPLIKFGRWILLTGIIVSLGGSLLQMVISRKLGVAELGLYYLAAKLAFIPNEVSRGVVGAVAFPLYARLQTNAHKILRVFRAILQSVSALIIPVCLFIIVLAPSLVANVLGSKWEGTVPLIQLLALVNIIGLFGDLAVPILKGMGRPHQLVVIELIQSVLLIALIWGLTDNFGVLGAPIAWLIAVGSSQLVSFFFIQSLLSNPFSGMAIPFFLITAISCFGSLAAWVVSTLMPGLFGLVVATLLGLAIVGILLWVADRGLALGLRQNLDLVFPQLTHLVGKVPVE